VIIKNHEIHQYGQLAEQVVQRIYTEIEGYADIMWSNGHAFMNAQHRDNKITLAPVCLK
jgi:hypothetical protein